MNDNFPFRLNADDVKRELVNLNQLVFEVTDACNLSCRYCIYGEMYSGFDSRNSQFLPFEKAKEMIDYLSVLWRDNVGASIRQPLSVSFYGGEPLLNFTFIRQVVDYIRSLQLHKQVKFSLTTNCVLLDRYMDYLSENDFYILCSLDGDRASNAYRVYLDGSPSFDRVYDNIKSLQAKYPIYFENNVQFNAVLHNQNNVTDILSFFKKEFNKVPKISEINSFGIRKEKKSSFKKAFRDMREDIFNAENKEDLIAAMKVEAPDTSELMYFLSTNLGNVYNSYSDLLQPETDMPKMPSGTCIPFSRKLFVKVDGKILPCERISHSFSYGVINDGKVNLDLQSVADQFNGYLDKIKSRCINCASAKGCMKCLYSIDTNETGQFVCDLFMDSSQLKEQELYFKNYLYLHPNLYKDFLNL